MRDPDARRIDLNATLRDPFGEIKVRAFRERRAITVNILADTSASMAFGRKWEALIAFCEATAYSAHRTGDSFAFQGGAQTLLTELHTLPTRARGAGALLATRLREWRPSGDSSVALVEAAQLLGRHPSLVFVISDFHWPLPAVRALMDSLARHAVVPVVLWDPAEFALPQRTGWHEVADLESGRQRTLWLRPHWRVQVRANVLARQGELRSLFLDSGTRPLALDTQFDASQVTEYFAGGGGWPDVAA